MKKSILFSAIIFFSFSAAQLFSLDLTSLEDELSDVFSSFTDDNEGLTTFRSLNIPAGGRAESLGSACTALADDITFFDYNAAASSVLLESEAAAFHNSWIADSAMETLAITSRNGHFGYGAQLKCFYVPFTEYNLFGEKVAGSYYSETSLTLNQSYNFLAGYDFKGIAIGVNERLSFRNMPDYANDQTDEIISGSGLEQSALAFMIDAGLLLRFNLGKFYSDREPNLKFGISLNNIGAGITGFGNSLTLDDALPTRVSVGFSYKPASPILLSAEFRQPVNLQDFSSSGKWSACTGLEISITKFFAFESGFLLQGGNPRISLGSEFEVKKIQMNVNYTFDLTSSVNPVNHISFSAKIKFGDKGRKKLQDEVDSYYTQGLFLYSEGKLEESIEYFNKALSIDKRFDPAKKALEAAQNFLDARNALDEIQNYGAVYK
ncbi:UPF0164 family protein [Treponema zioleckii]|uniref:UPF0164 family protein n=1 Tax=Treponema zioleckii TaxID=331680 RepID=UPI00168BEA5A|nr:UPF0164 family protein [Treponema zioleckii]